MTLEKEQRLRVEKEIKELSTNAIIEKIKTGNSKQSRHNAVGHDLSKSGLEKSMSSKHNRSTMMRNTNENSIYGQSMKPKSKKKIMIS